MKLCVSELGRASQNEAPPGPPGILEMTRGLLGGRSILRIIHETMTFKEPPEELMALAYLKIKGFLWDPYD